MSKMCIILRGLPGSGKSTMCKPWLDATICSADQYQVNEKGEYEFKIERASYAHEMCYKDFIIAITNNHPLVGVDNTNCDPVEIAPYWQYAKVMGYVTTIWWVKTPLEVCIKRQIHNVPLATYARMLNNLAKPLPPWWSVEEKV